MVFSSLVFMFMFLPVVLAVYYILPRKFRNVFLFIASLFFYGYGEPVYIILMLFSVGANYFFGMGIEKAVNNPKKAKALLIADVIINLSMLGFFKYAGFFVETLRVIPVFEGLEAISVPLPIGISFYTFQIMSYTIDVYRKECKAQKSFVLLGTYISLFPQLIAGPIVRYVDVENQLFHRKETVELFTQGVKLFVLGLFKKVLLANPLGEAWALMKASPDSGVIGAWIGIIAFTLQIYFDFSGYSDMARGLGKMLGFDFVKNFDFPYVAKSITEFWRRWHISLGTWFREYVYIPLGGNRCKKGRMVFNILAVWFLTGLWHGASWNFIIWGVYFGILLLSEKLFLLKILEKLPKALSHIYALFFIVVGWVIFDFTDIQAMAEYLKAMFTLKNGVIGEDALVNFLGYLPVICVGAFASVPASKKLVKKIFSSKAGFIWETIAVCSGVLLSVASLVNSGYNPFLYFRF